MSSSATLPDIASSITPDANWRKYIFAILFGNMACVFDFVIFVHLASVFSEAFFPTGSSTIVAQLQVLGLFSLGFLSRPLGALLIGRYGDVHGRIPALSISLMIFTITTLLMACLPTYAQVGTLAPVLFMFLRLVQGMAFGAQMPLGWVYVAEHAPTNKFAFYSSFVTASLTLGNILAFSLASVLNSTLTQATLVSHGWRIPFLVGGVLSIIALLLKRNIKETPLFERHKQQRQAMPKLSNVMPNFKRHQAIALTSVLAFAQISLVMLMIMTPKIIAIHFSFDNTFLFFAYMISLVSAIVGFIFYGWLADKYPAGNVIVGGALALIIHALIFYIYMPHSSMYYILPMFALLGFFSGIRALCPVIFVQLFPVEERLTSVSVIYNSVSAVVGMALPVSLFYASNILESAPGLLITIIGMALMMTGFVVQNSPGLNKFESLIHARQSYAKV